MMNFHEVIQLKFTAKNAKWFSSIFMTIIMVMVKVSIVWQVKNPKPQSRETGMDSLLRDHPKLCVNLLNDVK